MIRAWVTMLKASKLQYTYNDVEVLYKMAHTSHKCAAKLRTETSLISKSWGVLFAIWLKGKQREEVFCQGLLKSTLRQSAVVKADISWSEEHIRA